MLRDAKSLIEQKSVHITLENYQKEVEMRVTVHIIVTSVNVVILIVEICNLEFNFLINRSLVEMPLWYIEKLLFRLAALTPLTTTSIAPVSTSASKMTVTASFKETSIAGQTSKNIETTKPTFLTTKPTEFVKPTTSIKTDPDGNIHNFISIIIFHAILI